MKILFTGLIITTASSGCVQTEKQSVPGKPGFENRGSAISPIDPDLDQDQSVVVLASQHVSSQPNSLSGQQS